MNDFLGNLIANVMHPAAALQPRLGPFYGSSPSTFGEPRDETVFETEEAIAEAPLSDTPIMIPFSKQTIPVPIKSMELPSADDQTRPKDLLSQSEIQANSTVPRPGPPATLQQPASDREPPFAAPKSPRRKSARAANVALDLHGEVEVAMPRNAFSKMPGESPNGNSSRPEREPDLATKADKIMPAKVERQAQPLLQSPSPSEAASYPKAFMARQESEETRVRSSAGRYSPFSTIDPMFMARPDQSINLAAKNQSTESAGAPIIRVNIGRIEVRAVTPPPIDSARHQRSRSGPLLSLEDYLKQRNRGQR